MTIVEFFSGLFFGIINNLEESLSILFYIILIIVPIIIKIKRPDYLIAMAEKEYESRLRMLQDHMGARNVNMDFDLSDLQSSKTPFNERKRQSNIVCFAAGCPLLVYSSSLVFQKKENQTLLNITFQNIGEETITAIDLKINALDESQNIIAAIDNFQYPSVNISKGQIYYNSINIYLPSIDVDSIKMTVNKITFGNDNIVEYGQDYYVVNDGRFLSEWNANQQYYLQKNKSKLNLSAKKPMIFEPINTDEYWRCTCGQVNQNNQSICIDCNRNKDIQLTYINQDKVSSLVNQSSNESYMPSSREEVEMQIAQLDLEREKAKENAIKQRVKEAKFIGIAIILLLVLIVLLYS